MPIDKAGPEPSCDIHIGMLQPGRESWQRTTPARELIRGVCSRTAGCQSNSCRLMLGAPLRCCGRSVSCAPLPYVVCISPNGSLCANSPALLQMGTEDELLCSSNLQNCRFRPNCCTAIEALAHVGCAWPRLELHNVRSLFGGVLASFHGHCQFVPAVVSAGRQRLSC